jgi:hypothetical protein
MRTILFFSFFVHAMIVFGQDNSTLRKDSVNYKHAATLTLTAFPFSMGIQPGFQFRVGSKFDVLTEGAFASTKRAGSFYDRLKIMKLVSEVKYYPQKAFAGRYFSFQAGCINRKFTANDSGWYFKDTATLGYSSARIKSNLSFVSIKLGREINTGNRFFLDFFIGLGARYVCTGYEANDVYAIPDFLDKRDSIIEVVGYSWEDERGVVKLHGTAGFRMGIRF